MAKPIRKKIGILRNQANHEPRRCRGPQDLSRLELECMKAIWLEGAVTVLEVQQSLRPRRPLAYTTVLTVLDRLAKKGALQRVKKGKAYYYEPALSFIESRQKALTDLIEFYFQGSAENLLHYLNGAKSEPSAAAERVPMSSPEMTDCLL